MRGWIGLVLGAFALGSAPASAAVFTFSYGFNGVTYASGTITTDTENLFPGASNVIDVQGKRMGETITGFQSYFDIEDNSDQQLYPNRPAAYVDGQGLTFDIGDYSYNIVSPTADGPGGPNGFYTEYRYLTADPFGDTQSEFLSFFTLTPATVASVPEVGTWAMMVVGFGAIGGAMRRRRIAYAPATAFNR